MFPLRRKGRRRADNIPTLFSIMRFRPSRVFQALCAVLADFVLTLGTIVLLVLALAYAFSRADWSDLLEGHRYDALSTQSLDSAHRHRPRQRAHALQDRHS